MRKLGMSEEEIAEVLAADAEIDRGAKLFSLTAEQEKASKQARQADRKPTIYKLDNSGGKRSRKENPVKRTIINELADFLKKNAEFSAENVDILNPERQISFKIEENVYEITLSQKRKPKN